MTYRDEGRAAAELAPLEAQAQTLRERHTLLTEQIARIGQPPRQSRRLRAALGGAGVVAGVVALVVGAAPVWPIMAMALGAILFITAFQHFSPRFHEATVFRRGNRVLDVFPPAVRAFGAPLADELPLDLTPVRLRALVESSGDSVVVDALAAVSMFSDLLRRAGELFAGQPGSTIAAAAHTVLVDTTASTIARRVLENRHSDDDLHHELSHHMRLALATLGLDLLALQVRRA